jgi:hypothetical protein
VKVIPTVRESGATKRAIQFFISVLPLFGCVSSNWAAKLLRTLSKSLSPKNVNAEAAQIAEHEQANQEYFHDGIRLLEL